MIINSIIHHNQTILLMLLLYLVFQYQNIFIGEIFDLTFVIYAILFLIINIVNVHVYYIVVFFFVICFLNLYIFQCFFLLIICHIKLIIHFFVLLLFCTYLCIRFVLIFVLFLTLKLYFCNYVVLCAVLHHQCLITIFLKNNYAILHVFFYFQTVSSIPLIYFENELILHFYIIWYMNIDHHHIHTIYMMIISNSILIKSISILFLSITDHNI